MIIHALIFIVSIWAFVLDAKVAPEKSDSRSSSPFHPPSQDGIDKTMTILDDKLKAAMSESTIHLNDALMLNGSHSFVQLQYHVDSLRGRLVKRLRSDLNDVAQRTSLRRPSDGSFLQETREAFSNDLKKAWDTSVLLEMKTWEHHSLHTWAKKTRRVWDSVERKVERKLDHLTSFIKKQSCKSGIE
jgi:hypothetical protein